MDPSAIFKTLNEHGVRFVLVGGLAATAHGSSLATFDVDICFSRDVENCEALSRALQKLGATITPPRPVTVEIKPELLRAHKHLHLRTQAGRLDVLSQITGLGTFEEIFGEAIRLELDGIEIHMLSLEQLILGRSGRWAAPRTGSISISSKPCADFGAAEIRASRIVRPFDG